MVELDKDQLERERLLAFKKKLRKYSGFGKTNGANDIP